MARGEAVTRTAGEADEPFVELEEELEIERGGKPISGIRRRQETAEVGVARRRLDEERDVGAAEERHLRPRDRPHAERLRRMRELERAGDAVVVGQRERLVAELGRGGRKLLGLRGPVEEGVR